MSSGDEPAAPGPARRAPGFGGGHGRPHGDWQIGDVILDQYEVVRIHEAGGMGLVYQVHHRGWGIDLALKTPRRGWFDTEAQKQQFVLEAENWIELGLHPHIVSCYYVRTIEDIPRVFAEYVTGGSLADWIAEGRFHIGHRPTGEALRAILDVAIQFAWGLEHAHRAGMVHQDVKPANLLMTREGVAKVSDFGLGRLARGARPSNVHPAQGGPADVTAAGMTPLYRSPEQAAGERLTHATDTWSYALSILEMFAGGVFWLDGIVGAEALDAYLQEDHERSGPPMPKELSVLLRRCLELDPSVRPRNMGDIADRLIELYGVAAGAPYPRVIPNALELEAESVSNKAVSLVELGKTNDAIRLLDGWLEKRPFDLYPWLNRRMIGLQRSEAEPQDVALGLENLLSDLAKQGSEPVLDVEVAMCRAKLRRYLLPHQAPILSIALGPEERSLFAFTSDGRVHLWDLDTNLLVQSFDGGVAEFEDAARGTYFSLARAMSHHSAHRLAVTTDGKYLLTALRRSVRVVELARPERARQLEPGLHEVEHGMVALSEPIATDLMAPGAPAFRAKCVAISSDGRSVFAGGLAGAAVLVDFATGAVVGRLVGHKAALNAAAFGRDGRSLYTGTNHGLFAWDVATGGGRRLDPEGGQVITLATSPDGTRLLTGGSQDARLVALPGGELLRVMKGHKSAVVVAISADGRVGLTGSDDGASMHMDANGVVQTLGDLASGARLWDLDTGETLEVFGGHSKRITSVALSSDGKIAYTASEDGTVRIHRVDEAPERWPALLRRRLSVEEEAECLGAQELLLDRLESGDRRAYSELIALRARMPRLYRSTDLARDIVARSRGAAVPVELLDVWRERHIKTELSIDAVSLSSSGQLALVAGPDAAELWDLRAGKRVHVLAPRPRDARHTSQAVATRPPTGALLSSDGSSAVTQTGPGALSIWDTRTGALRQSIEGDVPLAFHPSGESIFTVLDCSLEQRRLADGALVRRFGEPGAARLFGRVPHPQAVSRDGVLIAHPFHTPGSDYAGGVEVYWVETGEWAATLRGDTGSATSCCFSADGSLVALGTQYQVGLLWSALGSQPIGTLSGHSAGLIAIALDPSNRTVVSSSMDLTVRIWDTHSARLLRSVGEHAAPVAGLVFSGDGHTLLTAGKDGVLGVWRLDYRLAFLEELLHDVEQLLSGQVASSTFWPRAPSLWGWLDAWRDLTAASSSASLSAALRTRYEEARPQVAARIAAAVKEVQGVEIENDFVEPRYRVYGALAHSAQIDPALHELVLSQLSAWTARRLKTILPKSAQPISNLHQRVAMPSTGSAHMFCVSCGENNTSGQSVCPHCGFLSGSQPAQAAAAPEPEPKRKRFVRTAPVPDGYELVSPWRGDDARITHVKSGFSASVPLRATSGVDPFGPSLFGVTFDLIMHLACPRGTSNSLIKMGLKMMVAPTSMDAFGTVMTIVRDLAAKRGVRAVPTPASPAQLGAWRADAAACACYEISIEGTPYVEEIFVTVKLGAGLLLVCKRMAAPPGSEPDWERFQAGLNGTLSWGATLPLPGRPDAPAQSAEAQQSHSDWFVHPSNPWALRPERKADCEAVAAACLHLADPLAEELLVKVSMLNNPNDPVATPVPESKKQQIPTKLPAPLPPAVVELFRTHLSRVQCVRDLNGLSMLWTSALEDVVDPFFYRHVSDDVRQAADPTKQHCNRCGKVRRTFVKGGFRFCRFCDGLLGSAAGAPATEARVPVAPAPMIEARSPVAAKPVASPAVEPPRPADSFFVTGFPGALRPERLAERAEMAKMVVGFNRTQRDDIAENIAIMRKVADEKRYWAEKESKIYAITDDFRKTYVDFNERHAPGSAFINAFKWHLGQMETARDAMALADLWLKVLVPDPVCMSCLKPLERFKTRCVQCGFGP